VKRSRWSANEKCQLFSSKAKGQQQMYPATVRAEKQLEGELKPPAGKSTQLSHNNLDGTGIRKTEEVANG